MNNQSLEKFRSDFPALSRRRNGKPPIYFDSACTSLVPRPVIASLLQYYEQYPACGGKRSSHWFAEEVTALIEGKPEAGITGARRAFAEFFFAGSGQ